MAPELARPAALPAEHIAPVDDLPTSHMQVRVLRDADELYRNLDRWQRLVATAVESNVFYEPCMLLPAIESLAADSKMEFVVVEAPSRKHPTAAPVWCGLFPLEKQRGVGPLQIHSLWRHIHCFLCTPLLRSDVATEALNAFLSWQQTTARGRSLLKFDYLGADGPFHRLLVEACRQRQIGAWLAGRHTRALLRRAASGEAYMLAAMPRKRRHEYRRLARRLTELGRVEYACLQPQDDVEAWIDRFLELESGGWKGRSGTAMSCSESQCDFFRAMARRAFERGQLLMSSLRLDGKPLAQKCSLQTGSGSFAFKIAFDQDLAKFSPGALLELHNIEMLHELPGIEWMDSCAAADHPMINGLWSGRRMIESLWLSGAAPLAQAAVAAMPLAKWCRGRLRFSSRKKESIPSETVEA